MIRSLVLLAAVALATSASSQTFVVNQGQFIVGGGTGSVTSIQGDVATQLFENQLGATLQSATRIGDKLYLLSSASRVDVVDMQTQMRVGQIGGGDASPFSTSPRYLEGMPEASKAFVTNQVYTGDPSFILPLTLQPASNSATFGDPIEIEGGPETMALSGDSLYVALGSGGAQFGGVDSLGIVDARTNTVAGYLDLDCYARFVIASSEDVLVFCESTNEMLVIDQENRSVAQRLAFGEAIGDSPFNVGQTVGYGPEVYLVRSAGATSPPPNYVVTASGVALIQRTTSGTYEIASRLSIPDVATKPISAVAFTGQYIALGRPDVDNPFTADGTVTLHDPITGELVVTYPAGIYPAHIVPPFVGNTAAEQEAAARALNLELAGPNPARAASALAFTLRQPEAARVTIHDLLGRTVATVADRGFSAGDQRVELDVSGLAPGPYRVRLAVGDRVASLPLTVVR